mmetsp:Transcript_50970/g.121968  ORF Transcript_50970/g.121968 Transcript_50970/m.121968 type:complete len:202 (-) Transcript_50970:500-1105(-)
MLLQDGPQPVHQEDRVRVHLQDPVVVEILSVRKNLLPNGHERSQVQNRHVRPTELSQQRAVHPPGKHPWHQLQQQGAVDGVVVARKNVGAKTVLHDEEILLLREGQAHRQAQHPRRAPGPRRRRGRRGQLELLQLLRGKAHLGTVLSQAGPAAHEAVLRHLRRHAQHCCRGLPEAGPGQIPTPYPRKGQALRRLSACLLAV